MVIRFDAVLFDRDGTLVHDVPYNGDPALVRPVLAASSTLERLRAAGLRIGVVTNQSGLARGYFTYAQLDAVRAEVERRLGSFDTWQTCPHEEQAGCACRKPKPGLVFAAAAELGVPVRRCVVVGDTAADIGAAQAAGAVGVLVPTPRTRPTEIASAPLVFDSLAEVADWVGTEPNPGHSRPPGRATRPASRVPLAPPDAHVLAVRADSAGDVLLTGPAIRAMAARAAKLTLLCGPRGRAAAALLPGVRELVEWTVPWLEPQPPPVVAAGIGPLVKRLAGREIDRAVIFTSAHQSSLPTALLLRLAGVAHVSAISADYPGSLLDVRVPEPGERPEPRRALALARAAGYPLPPGDDGRLRLREPLPDVSGIVGAGPFVVAHPGTSVPARACPPWRWAAFVAALGRAGWRVLVTGAPSETALTSYVAAAGGVDLGGLTSLARLAAVLRRARCAIVANTGAAHLAAAVGTPVVSLFAPTVPFGRWAPYGVPVVRLGDAAAGCRDSRATLCPVPGHPCLSTVEPAAVLAAVAELTCAS